MLRRREFTGATVAIAAAPFAAKAQALQRPARIALFAIGSNPYLPEFLDALRRLGWVDGKTMTFRPILLPSPVDEREESRSLDDLLAFKPDLIVAPGTTLVESVMARTKSIPVVFVTPGDPVVQGLVASYAQPGGNATGTSTFGPEIAAKNLQLFREIVPGLSRISVMYGRDALPFRYSQPSRAAAAQQFGMTLRLRPLVKLEDIETAFDAARADNDDGAIVIWDVFTGINRLLFAANAVRVRLPCFYNDRSFVAAGGLISYSAKISANFERAAVFVDKILRGARPADLPVEQARTFDMFVNMQAARAIGVTFPETILLRADEIIE